ncbi:MAG: serine protease [Tannerella sp.]|jgi:tetratricopeptide (TPR) repeat protein|nr:serine protease [Tannerella sp.]
MKKILILFLVAAQTLSVEAKEKTPKWIEKAAKAIITIETTAKEGATKSGSGFFIRENGEAVSSYELFRDCIKGVVTTAEGEKLNVVQILGADDMYGVVRFKVAVPKKTAFLKIAETSPVINTMVYLLTATATKKQPLAQGAISEITKVKGVYDYYQVELASSAKEGLPLLNDKGEVFAFTQQDATGKGKSYGIAVAYIQNVQVVATDMFKRAYTDIGIRKAWAQSVDEAKVSLLLYSSQQDVQTYLETLDDFIATFPDNIEGYLNRASHYAYNRKELSDNEQQSLDRAWEDLEQAAKQNKDKADADFNKAKLIFGVVTTDSTVQYKDWNIPAALKLVEKAIERVDLPTYRSLEGDIAFNNRDFERAYHSYSLVNASDIASGASYFLAAKSKQQIPGYNYMEIIMLLDSAVLKSPPAEAAAYLLESVELKMQVGLYKEAVTDYNRYYLLSGGKVNDGFYYYREQAKFRAEDFAGALKDINIAITMDFNNSIYFAEKAAVCLRLKDLPTAQENAEQAIKIQPDFAAAYRILGIAMVRQEKTSEACLQFAKAKELGDPVVD